MISTQEKAEIVKKFGKGPNDSGSAEVQVAILTARITGLTPHFSKHIHDFHSKRGLLKLIGKRRRLLKYINKQDPERYTKLIKELGLRK
jgi:small subunit ribosomal protein S15